MRRAVIQAYVGVVPWWMAKCISTVKEWCAKNNVDYIWYDTAPGTIEARFGMKDVPHLFFQKFEWIAATKGYDSLMWVDTDIIVQGNPQFEWQSGFTIENRQKDYDNITMSFPQGGLFFGTRVGDMAQWMIDQSHLPWPERNDIINYLVALWNFKRPDFPIYDQNFIGVWIDQFGHTALNLKKYLLWSRRPYDCDDDCFIHFVARRYDQNALASNKMVQYQQLLMLRMWQKKERRDIAFKKK